MPELAGKVAFITGASAGSGAAVAHAFSERGIKLGLASRRGTDLGLPGALGLRCDVGDLEQLEAAVTSTVERFGKLDVLVANAGVGSYHPFLDLPLEHLEGMNAFRPLAEASWG